mgnify:CR=1 FL=1
MTMLTLKKENKIKRVTVDYPMDQVADSVLKLKDSWESRSDDFPFFSLGKSAYLDGYSPEYFLGAWKCNGILIKAFEPLYDKVSEVLGREMGEEIFLESSLALPAFHIFPSDEKLLSISGNWHIDNPHTILDLGNMNASAFTLPVMLPTGGGGMDFEDGYYPYSVGEMVIHDGKKLHRIASYKKYKKDEYRITFQGHIVRNDRGKLIMFW